MSRLIAVFSSCLFGLSSICWPMFDSGPSVNEAAPVLKVNPSSGEQAGQEVE